MVDVTSITLPGLGLALCSGISFGISLVAGVRFYRLYGHLEPDEVEDEFFENIPVKDLHLFEISMVALAFGIIFILLAIFTQ